MKRVMAGQGIEIVVRELRLADQILRN